MRKTRLVILPAKCLHQIGFLLLFLSCPVIGDWGRIRPESENLHRSIQIQREGTCGLQRHSPALLHTLYSNGSDQCKTSEFNDFIKRVIPINLKSNALRLDQMRTKRQITPESLKSRVAETRRNMKNLGRSVVRRDMKSTSKNKSFESRLLLEKKSRSMEKRQNEKMRLMTLSRFNDNTSQKNEGRYMARLPLGGRTTEQEKGERVQNRGHFNKEVGSETELLVSVAVQRRNNKRQVRKTIENVDFKREIGRQQKKTELQNRFLTSQRRVLEKRSIILASERRERDRELRSNGVRSLERREERLRIFALQRSFEREYEKRDKRKLVRPALSVRSVVSLAEPIKNERVSQTVLENSVRGGTGSEGQETERMGLKIRERNSSKRQSQSEIKKDQRRAPKKADLFRNQMIKKLPAGIRRINIRREIETTRFFTVFPMGTVSDEQEQVEGLKTTMRKLELDGKANENQYFNGLFKWMGLDNYNHYHQKVVDWTTNCVVGAFAYFLTSRKVKAV